MAWWGMGAPGVYSHAPTVPGLWRSPPMGAHAVTVVGFDNAEK
jgi:hypothetical protein